MPPNGRKQPPAKPAAPSAERAPKLSEEERTLWEQVNRETKPLKGRGPRASPPESPMDEAPAETSAEAAAQAVKRVAKRTLPARASALPLPRPKPPPVLAHGDIADLDKRSAERMRRGRLPIEGSLDLHGHGQDEARRELAAFLARAQAAGKRCVVVITGKGDIAQGGGVLRTQVPRWLNEPENRARVLAFDYALPRHGGLGALYVLLRKARS